MLAGKEILLACPIIFILWFSAASATDATVCSIAAHPEAFDQQKVDIQGLAADVKKTTSQSGNEYTTFKVIDPTGCGAVKVFAWQHPALRTGDKIRVDGVFETQHHQGTYIFQNELQAERVTPLQ